MITIKIMSKKTTLMADVRTKPIIRIYTSWLQTTIPPILLPIHI